ncbi:unnamed protein product, partial [Meganyctiphanes norvegica]
MVDVNSLVQMWVRLLLVVTVCLAKKSLKGTRPNIIIMNMDDMGWGDLGHNGEPNRETPRIDQLAAEGLTATSMYTAAPLCSPSRASLLTGRLPVRNGFYSDNLPGRNAYTPQDIVGGISADEILLPELLSTANYTSKIIGKWHLGHRSPHLPLERGFDQWYGSPNCHFGPYDDKTTPNIPVFRNDKMVGRYYEEFPIHQGESNMTVLFTSEAVSFIHEQAGKEPFFLYWAPDATHSPTYASKAYMGGSKRGKYGDSVRELDAGVGAIMDALNATEQSNNTLVVFTSDNGAQLISKFDGGSNGPFLCGKQTTFEGGMRAPGIFWWPAVIKPGSVTHQVWTQMDLFSTSLEVAGVELPNDRFLDGMPLARSFQHPELEVLRPVFLYRGDRLMAVRQGAYKIHVWTWSTPDHFLVKGIDFCPGSLVPNVTTSNATNHTNQPILFNIEIDPSERYPIHPSNPTYQQQVPQLLAIVKKHEDTLQKGTPQLNWCDDHVMHWAPPGCEELNKCLPAPPSNPTKCYWDH